MDIYELQSRSSINLPNVVLFLIDLFWHCWLSPCRESIYCIPGRAERPDRLATPNCTTTRFYSSRSAPERKSGAACTDTSLTPFETVSCAGRDSFKIFVFLSTTLGPREGLPYPTELARTQQTHLQMWSWPIFTHHAASHSVPPLILACSIHTFVIEIILKEV